ncbi:hypothetical protein B0A55_01078 [Friedmanniomyces simplex]|uniref:Uncharacterized protein n=1 Tax=Friedmanniomyces simplex TaxID=329884 RepID=A0A4U0Y125_9PEZI|nr:hypothetical protein B0A55_01078 [Friedmanniomyces simplex]
MSPLRPPASLSALRDAVESHHAATPKPASKLPSSDNNTLATATHQFATSSRARVVTLTVDSRKLFGTLHLISVYEYNSCHYLRFFDILPSDSVAFKVLPADDVVTLVHSVHGVSWGRSCESPTAVASVEEEDEEEDVVKSLWGVGVKCEAEKRPADGFLAVTDDEKAWEEADFLGKCSLDGVFVTSQPSFGNVILAFPLQKPLGSKNVGIGRQIKSVSIYPPVPVLETVLQTVEALEKANQDPENCTNSGDLAKKYLKAHFKHLLDPVTLTLSPKHSLFDHRNNVTLFDTRLWKTLCTSSAVDAKNRVEALPEAYFQHVFEDKRERERLVEGSERLVEGLYGDDEEEMEAEVRGREALLKRPAMEYERTKAREAEEWMRWLLRKD